MPDAAGGDFFFELHYNLHAGNTGMILVGIAGMMMLVALVAGVIIHKRIFRDFFTFRPRAGGQRAWLDGHNLTGVLDYSFGNFKLYPLVDATIVDNTLTRETTPSGPASPRPRSSSRGTARFWWEGS